MVTEMKKKKITAIPSLVLLLSVFLVLVRVVVLL